MANYHWNGGHFLIKFHCGDDHFLLRLSAGFGNQPLLVNLAIGRQWQAGQSSDPAGPGPKVAHYGHHSTPLWPPFNNQSYSQVTNISLMKITSSDTLINSAPLVSFCRLSMKNTSERMQRCSIRSFFSTRPPAGHHVLRQGLLQFLGGILDDLLDEYWTDIMR